MTLAGLLAAIALAITPAPGAERPENLAGPQRDYRTTCGWFETADERRAFIQLGREVRCSEGARLASRIDPPFKPGPSFPRSGRFKCHWAQPGVRYYVYCRDTTVREWRVGMTGYLGVATLTITASRNGLR